MCGFKIIVGEKLWLPLFEKGQIKEAELESCPNQPHLGDKTQHSFRHGVDYLITKLIHFLQFKRDNYEKNIFILYDIVCSYSRNIN